MNDEIKKLLELARGIFQDAEEIPWNEIAPGHETEYKKNDLCEVFEEDLKHFLFYIAASDGEISMDEAEYMQELLGIAEDADEITEYIEANNIYSVAFEKKVPLSLTCAGDIDWYLVNAGKEARFVQTVIELFEVAGKDLIACEIRLAEDEENDLNTYMGMLRTFQSRMEAEIQKKLELKKKEKPVEEKAEAGAENEEEETLEELMEKLSNLTGLQEVKQDIGDMIDLMKIRTIRNERRLKVPSMSLHMVFSGNPGTGKTTVARLLSKIYHRIGVLSQGQLIEVDRSGLVGGYVGQTALKVKEVVEEAIGGILFIDEAYSLAVGGEVDYGKEAINTLLKCMEDNRDDLIVIVAGYPQLMETFLDSNPGLRSRFNKHIYFRDYNSSELLDIFQSMCDECGYIPNDEARKYLEKNFEQICDAKKPNFANGREVRNFFEKTLVAQAKRLVKIEDPTDEELNTITLSDLMNVRRDRSGC